MTEEFDDGITRQLLEDELKKRILEKAAEGGLEMLETYEGYAPIPFEPGDEALPWRIEQYTGFQLKDAPWDVRVIFRPKADSKAIASMLIRLADKIANPRGVPCGTCGREVR